MIIGETFILNGDEHGTFFSIPHDGRMVRPIGGTDLKKGEEVRVSQSSRDTFSVAAKHSDEIHEVWKAI